MFAHWPLPVDALRSHTFDDRAWLGITPFEVLGLRAPLPHFAARQDVLIWPLRPA